MSLDKVTIPNYSRSQERFKALSHLLGVSISVAVFVFALVNIINGNISAF